MNTTQTPTLSRWQDPEGYPNDAYFGEVEHQLELLGVLVVDAWQDEPWDCVLSIDPAGLPYERLLISWVVDEHCDPLAGGFTGHGWCWVPYTHTGQGAADEVAQFDVPFLAEPEQVAAAVFARMCVTRGAQLFDERDPDWWRTDHPHPVDVDRLDMGDSSRCILGQRYDGHPDADPDEDGPTAYDLGLRDLFPALTDGAELASAAIWNGFAGWGAAGDFAALTAEWRRGILSRRGAREADR